jgi:MFS family permease
MGGNGFHVGLLSAAFALSRLVCAPWFGRHSDRSGRKAWIVGGLFLYAGISAWLGDIRHLGVLIAARALHGVAAAMLIPLLQAYVGDLAPHGREGRLMGVYGTVVLLGLGIGPVLGGAINDHLGVRAAFLAMGALAAAGAMACGLCLPAARDEARAARAHDRTSWGTLLRERSLVGLIVFRFSHVTGIGMVWSFLPLYMTVHGSHSSAAAGLVVGAGVIASAMLNIPMGALADRIDRRILIVTGGAAGCIGLLALGASRSIPELVAASACYGIGGGVAIPAAMATVTRHGQRNAAMGTLMAFMASVHGAGMLVGALAGGLVMDHFGISAVFPAGTAMLVGGTLVFALCSLPAHRRAGVPGDALTNPLH